MATITFELDPETALKLNRRAARAGMTPCQAVQIIAVKGVSFFLTQLVGATMRGKTAASQRKGVRS